MQQRNQCHKAGQSDDKRTKFVSDNLSGEPLAGILNLDRNMKSFLTVETVTDCEIVSTPVTVIQRLVQENIEVTLIYNRMQGISALREYEYRKNILTGTPVQKYEYFRKIYPDLIETISNPQQSWWY